jgi:hypothetical protein
MPRLAPEQSYRRIKPVDISRVLPIVNDLAWFHVNQEGKSAGSYGCDVVLKPFPNPVGDLIDGLGIGGRLARAILRRLEPFQSIPLHVDSWMPEGADWRRFQVPLVSDPSIVMAWPDAGESVYLEPGFLWEVRYETPHEVVNGWDGRRIHLQIDAVDATI